MKKEHSFNLISGEFNVEDTKEILAKLLQHKINYHQLRITSSIERTGMVDFKSSKRLEELELDLQKVLELVNSIDKDDYFFEIHSTVNLQLIKKKEMA